MPKEWRRSTLIPIYKNKGDIQNCENYIRIKLMSHIMKFWERVTKYKLRKEIHISKNQFDFMLGKLTTEAIYFV